MNQNKDLQKVINNGRSSTLKDVKETPLELPDKKLLKKLTEENYGEDIRSLYQVGNAHRTEWLTRQESFLAEYDQFISPIYARPAEWASATHLPIALTIAKSYHARFFAAIFSQSPPFTVSSRSGANFDREAVIQDLLEYTVKDWVNGYDGLEPELDKALWNWVTRGVFLTKNGWDKRYTQFKDIVNKPITKLQNVVGPDGKEMAVSINTSEPTEQDVTMTDFDGPTVRAIQPEDLVLIGSPDPDKADAVLESTWLNASDMYTMVDRGLFDKAAVDEVVSKSGDNPSSKIANGIKTEQARNAGLANMINTPAELTRFHVLECYVKKDVYGSGINSEIVVWVHETTGIILRASYLHRINSKTKKRPYAKAEFYTRPGQLYGVGLVELIYSITKEIDSLNNMAVDFGMISSMPFGYVRASSSLQNVSMPIEPGALIPLDNPTQDVYFPQLGNRGGWAGNQIQFLYSMIERLTGMSDLSFGMIGAQGATRTASGVRAVMQESNTNLDIFLRRLNRPLKKIYKQLLADIQAKMPKGLEFRITGDDGSAYFRQIKTADEIAGSFDFELEPNSQASNPHVKIENAQQIYQMTANPMDIQLGIITPLERYEAAKNLLQAIGIKDYGRFLKKPAQQMRQYSPEELCNRILAGVPTSLSPMDDLEGFLAYAQYIMDTDELIGQFNQNQAVQLAAKVKEATQIQQAMKAMAANQAVANQMQSNAQNSAQQTQPMSSAVQAPQMPDAGGQ